MCFSIFLIFIFNFQLLKGLLQKMLNYRLGTVNEKHWGFKPVAKKCKSRITKQSFAMVKTWSTTAWFDILNLIKEYIPCLIGSPRAERHKGWLKCPKDCTRALISPSDVHHKINLSNTIFITYIYTSFSFIYFYVHDFKR